MATYALPGSCTIGSLHSPKRMWTEAAETYKSTSCNFGPMVGERRRPLNEKCRKNPVVPDFVRIKADFVRLKPRVFQQFYFFSRGTSTFPRK